MHLLKSVLRIQICTARSFINPASLFFTELFNPEQYHMLAVTEGLKLFHGIGGGSLSWIASIVGSTVLLRSAIATPLYTYTEKNQALVSRAYYESLREISENVARTSTGKIDKKLAPVFQRTFMGKCHTTGCHPYKSAVFAIFQLPFWITATCGLRNACGIQVTPFVFWPPMIPDFMTEGLIDPTTSMALIGMVAVVTTLNVELSHLRRVYNLAVSQSAEKSTLPDHRSEASHQIVAVLPPRLPWQFRLVHVLSLASAVLLSVIAVFAPCALTVYWCTSSSHQLLLNIAHLSPRIRSFLAIPVTPVDPKRPYFILWQIAKQHYRILRWLK